MANFGDEINILEYILKNFIPLKLAGPTLEVVFENAKTLQHKQNHGQLKCKNLIFPFSKAGFMPVEMPVKQISTIVESSPKNRVKEIVELILDNTHENIENYAPGDTIAILPRNNKTEVDFLLNMTQLLNKADNVCEVRVHPDNPKKNLKTTHVPLQTSPRELLTDILNIRAIPKKQFLRTLAECCESKDEQDFLNCLASKEGASFYSELILEKGFTLCDLLKICVSCLPELRLLVEHLPRLMPRPYSVANSPLANEQELKIIFSILNERPGVTTGMLASKLKENKLTNVIIYPRQVNQFRYTSDDFEKNQILIAIGTGIAPFLGFLEHKSILIKKNIGTPGLTWLFIGAPTEAAIPQRVQLLEYQERNIIQRYFESFSRVSDATFHYIQDQFMANATELVEFLMHTNTILYVCADGAKISQSIETALMTCLKQELHLPLEEAKLLLKQFRSNGKYREDLWT